MTDRPDDLILQMSRRTDAKVDRPAEDTYDNKVRLTAVDESPVGVQRRIDRLELRVDRIERRLNLVDRPH